MPTARWTSADPRRDRAQPIAEALRERIAAGDLRPGDRLEESELGAAYTASRNSVREALDLLVADGLVERKRGVGTRVGTPKLGHGLDRLAGLGETLLEQGEVRNEALEARRLRRLPKDVAARLDQAPEDGGVRIRRLRSLQTEPLSLDVSYFPADVGASLLSADLAGTDVFELLEESLGTRLGSAQLVVHADVADAELATLLEIGVGDPVFRIDRLTRLPGGRPVDAEQLLVRADRIALEATIERDR
ncbi:GntR family transcriptional regulator [Flexivirga sp. ID2601S]|uniref:GntR family transcriptional regulator n=1 Tax=Flexivirga aerilata TaxID=1656889 RepID=A0A849AG90_9MICO|nr:GntR family transcriptional regulator [Flexivirga aerilata]NNG38228.1 GntR family transcriptional regulator [Flexivirga aerilata]